MAIWAWLWFILCLVLAIGYLYSANRYLTTIDRLQSEHSSIVASVQTQWSRAFNEQREDNRVLVEAIARSKDAVPVVYPRREPLEAASGWFDGKSKMKVTDGR